MNRAMTVSQLSSYLKGVFDDEELLHDVTLTGEVADISYSDKHTFLTLADGTTSVRCVHFSSRDQIEKGARVALRGSVRFYDKRSAITFSYQEYFLDGVGDKNKKLLELKGKLYKLGYFENRKQLPPYIVNVVAVTSPDGAAIRDFMRVVYDKCPFVNIRVYPVKVQGEGAAAQMATAIRRLQSCRTDAIVLCRGGGSDEDLDCFNDENLATAVAQSEIPIISAVGHEIDYTLCDFCAGTRAGTPSIAGEIVNSRAIALVDSLRFDMCDMRDRLSRIFIARTSRVNRLGTAVTHGAEMRINDSRKALELTMRRGIYAVTKKSDAIAVRLSSVGRRLMTAVVRFMSDKRADVGKLSALLSALDPHRIIKTGYAAVVADGKSVSSVHTLKRNDEVTLVFADGTASAVITEIKR